MHGLFQTQDLNTLVNDVVAFKMRVFESLIHTLTSKENDCVVCLTELGAKNFKQQVENGLCVW